MNPIFMVLINVLIMVNSESPESSPPSLFENLGAFFGQEMFVDKCTFVVVGKTIWYVLKKLSPYN